MKEPVLIIMAAGMGSRFGGLKQIEKVTKTGEIIMDFSLYDAMMAGFKKAIFVIKEEHEKDFRELLDERVGKYLDIEYAFQKLEDLPKEYSVPKDRKKPWGTAHAVMSTRNLIDGPFAVINADDYYGPNAFHSIYDFLSKDAAEDSYDYCMVGYELKNTITENGHVARGVCDISKNGFLEHVVERSKIMRVNGEIAYTEDEKTWHPLPNDSIVSMNFWGFRKSMMKEMIDGFTTFLDGPAKENPLKSEYFLPGIADNLIQSGKATVTVLNSTDKWYGVTYKEDKDDVADALQSMKDKGLYPEKLWK